jgi:hypothetical protein
VAFLGVAVSSSPQNTANTLQSGIAPAALAAVLPRHRRGFWLRVLCFGLGAHTMFLYGKLLPTG